MLREYRMFIHFETRMAGCSGWSSASLCYRWWTAVSSLRIGMPCRFAIHGGTWKLVTAMFNPIRMNDPLDIWWYMWHWDILWVVSHMFYPGLSSQSKSPGKTNCLAFLQWSRGIGIDNLGCSGLMAWCRNGNLHPIDIYTYIDSSLESLAYIGIYLKILFLYVPMISKHTYYVYLYMFIKHYIKRYIYTHNLWPYIYINIVLHACFYWYDPWPCWGRSTHSAKRCTVSGLQSGTLALAFQNDAGMVKKCGFHQQ